MVCVPRPCTALPIVIRSTPVAGAGQAVAEVRGGWGGAEDAIDLRGPFPTKHQA